jgi:hypothetical protein
MSNQMNKKIVILLVCLALTACSTQSQGYEVSNIAYTFNQVDPLSLDLIAFDLDRPARAVEIGLSYTDYPCESAEPFTHWTCPLGGVMFASGMTRVIVTE